MGDRETITVAEISDGPGGQGDPGTEVSVPTVEVLTGRGFITGKSGSGKSNTASVVVEDLLEAGFPVLIVDIDGEYYGLKEKYEILHAGSDEECDIRVGPEHAEKIASLALEGNVPIILDVSSFLDESKARELLTAVARQLFAREKKLKKPFLLIVEEIHEYVPEGGGIDECGKMLIKIGKRGRKHGLGITGISQRPADVKKDFITQCDWIVWHRLTWNNDTDVVGRVLDGEYASAVEDLDDGEGFLMTDWSESVRRVQFHRKQTFDAGATPGLDDFERPDLKSVSDDLLDELEDISETEQAREDRLEQLREELDRKNSRIAELEAELQDARDLQRMAQQFTEALIDHVEGQNPGRTHRDAVPLSGGSDGSPATDRTGAAPGDGSGPLSGLAPFGGGESGDRIGRNGHDEGPVDATDDGEAAANGIGEPLDVTAIARGFDGATDRRGDGAIERNGDGATDREEDGSSGRNGDRSTDGPTDRSGDEGLAETDDGRSADRDRTNGRGRKTGADGSSVLDGSTASFAEASPTGTASETCDSYADVSDLLEAIRSLDAKERRMLRYYRNQGPETPTAAHFSAGGSDDRTAAYARNRRLRLAGFVEHVGRGRYAYRLPELLAETVGGADEDGSVKDGGDVEADDDLTDPLHRLERAILTGE